MQLYFLPLHFHNFKFNVVYLCAHICCPFWQEVTMLGQLVFVCRITIFHWFWQLYMVQLGLSGFVPHTVSVEFWVAFMTIKIWMVILLLAHWNYRFFARSFVLKKEKKNPVSCVIDPGVVYVLSYGDVDWQHLEYASKTCVQTHNTPTD